MYAEFPFYGLSRTNVFMFIYTVFLNERSNQFVKPIYRFLCVQLRYRSSNESREPGKQLPDFKTRRDKHEQPVQWDDDNIVDQNVPCKIS